MATLAELKTMLAEAEAAQHKLLTLKQPVSITYQGRTVTYRNSPDDAKLLASYIGDLKAKIKSAGGCRGRSAIPVRF